VLLLSPVSRVIVWWIGALIGLAGLRALGARRLSPILLLCFPLVALTILATPLRTWGAPWLYVGFDLQWWLLALVAALIAVGADRVAAVARVETFGRLQIAVTSPPSRRLAEAALIIVLAAGSLASSPPMRFQSVLVGDEPKYLRYLESWYRGRGMDVADLGAIADLPPHSSSNVAGNVRLLGSALARVASDMESDVRRLLGRPARPRPGPSKSLGGWFVQGKRGGQYQVHPPGISALLFPGYFVDRAISRTQAWHPQFPSNLYFTNLTVLILYLLWAVATLRLLWTYTGRVLISWLLTAVVFMSLPVSAFAYQYYPEVAAGLGVALLARYALLSTDVRARPAAAYGVLTGFLPWLHLRFLPLTLGAVVAVALTRRGSRWAIAAFLAGLAPPLVALSVFDYHVTGSLMPWALYALTTDASLFSAARAWRDLPALWLDRTWGLVAHSPIYLFTIPGFWWSWRRNKPITIATAAAILAVAVPAAGHGYTGAYTTPLRLVAAVVPLLAIPLAETALTYGRLPWVAAAIAFAGVISVQNGLTYNVHLVKSEAYLQGASISGWMFPLLLPDFEAIDRLDQPLTKLWIVVTAALVAYPFVAARLPQSWRRPHRRPPPVALAAGLIVAFAVTASAVSAATGLRFRPTFMLKAGDARDRLIHFALTHDLGVQWSSKRGAIDVTTYFPETEGTTATIIVRPEAPTSSRPVEFALQIRRPDSRPGWGTAVMNFGDGSPPARTPVEDTAYLRHAYAAGSYTLTVEFNLWGLPQQSVSRVLRVD
jgi:hypothetical protein